MVSIFPPAVIFESHNCGINDVDSSSLPLHSHPPRLPIENEGRCQLAAHLQATIKSQLPQLKLISYGITEYSS